MYKYGFLQCKSVPGPQIPIRINSSAGNSIEVEAIVDTAAVMTCVPEKSIYDLGNGTIIYNQKTVHGCVGDKICRTYILDLSIGKCTFRDIEVVALDKEFALIGRDILNKYKITFDGPKGSWRVLKNVHH